MRATLYACTLALAFTAGVSSGARAQSPAPPPAGVATVDGPMAAGARDPFVRPTVPESDAAPARLPVARVEGLAGLSVEEVAVRGVVRAGDRSLGLLQAGDKKHYVVRPGDRLRDGLVEAVITDGVVIAVDPDEAAAGGGRAPLRRSLRVGQEAR